MKHETIFDRRANIIDAHIYFQSWSVEESMALDIAEKLESLFGDAVEIHYPPDSCYESPHPSSHIDVLFGQRDVPRILAFFRDNHRDLSVVVHAETGNPRADMTEQAVIFGRPVAFEFAA